MSISATLVAGTDRLRLTVSCSDGSPLSAYRDGQIGIRLNSVLGRPLIQWFNEQTPLVYTNGVLYAEVPIVRTGPPRFYIAVESGCSPEVAATLVLQSHDGAVRQISGLGARPIPSLPQSGNSRTAAVRSHGCMRFAAFMRPALGRSATRPGSQRRRAGGRQPEVRRCVRRVWLLPAGTAGAPNAGSDCRAGRADRGRGSPLREAQSDTWRQVKTDRRAGKHAG